jgi:hypothetical protein
MINWFFSTPLNGIVLGLILSWIIPLILIILSNKYDWNGPFSIREEYKEDDLKIVVLSSIAIPLVIIAVPVLIVVIPFTYYLAKLGLYLSKLTIKRANE